MMKRFSNHCQKNSAGFTLIELLVVIAIIGILSSVVLASLNTARGKGANAAIKSNLGNMRAQAELVYYAAPNSYAAICADPTIIRGLTAAANVSGGTVLATNAANTAGNTTCDNASGSWVVQSTLKTPEAGNAYWCIDTSGTARADNILAGASATVCP